MSDSLVVDAWQLDQYQQCHRRPLLSADWQSARRRPKSLFDSQLRNAIFTLSAGSSADAAATTARGKFMELAADPGLDLPRGRNPYIVARDWCIMYDTILRAIAKLTLLVLHEPEPIHLDSRTTWRFLSRADDSGTLHRWITLDRWDEEALSRDLHSWYVMGDVAMTRCPMVLHVIEIGQERKGRRASPWARAWRHPTMPNLPYRFRNKDGSKPNNWNAIYLTDDLNLDHDDWVDEMEREGVARDLIHHVDVRVPTDAVCNDTLCQIQQETFAMRRLLTERTPTTFRSVAMSRGACDGIVPCPWQEACYSASTMVELDTLGVYLSRETMGSYARR